MRKSGREGLQEGVCYESFWKGCSQVAGKGSPERENVGVSEKVEALSLGGRE